VGDDNAFGRCGESARRYEAEVEPPAPEPPPGNGAKSRRKPTIDPDDFKNDIVTEDNGALAFADRYRDRLKYCHSTGAWFEWDGNTWRRNETRLALQFARELVRTLACTEKARVRYVASRLSFAHGVERFAQADPIFAVTADYWDRDPWLLGTPGGIVNLHTGHVRSGDPADGITRRAAVAPADTAQCPLWLRFLAEATGADAPLIRFLRQWCGYCLTGITREHALVFVYGPGGNGKSVFLNVLAGILADYASAATIETFTASKYDRHLTEIAALRGVRAVTASETEKGRFWAETRVKQLTGGDRMRARFMRQDEFEFTPVLKLIVVGNHMPALHNVDEAMRRRFNVVPFTRTPARPDDQLETKLKTEWPGILRWMIDGCLDWQASGLVRPVSVAAATEDYFAAQDVLAHWLDEVCDAEPGNTRKSAPVGDLFRSWSAFAQQSGEEPGTRKAFTQELKNRYFIAKKGTRGVRMIVGLRLKPETGELFNDD
jgi:putative DNA primase/helicase